MTDRHAGYIVVLENDIRDDDAEAIITALRQVRGVIDVKPVLGGHLEMHIAESRVDRKWHKRILDLLDRA